jgi:hypothetical protein
VVSGSDPRFQKAVWSLIDPTLWYDCGLP